MPKFKDKVIRKYDGGFNQPGAKGADPYSKQEEVPQFIKDFFTPGQQITKTLGDSVQASRPLGVGAEYDPQAAVRLLQQNQMDKSKNTAQNNPPSVIAKPVPAISAKGGQKGPPAKKGKPVAPVANVSPASYGPNKSQRLLDSYLDQNINSANVYDSTMSSLPIKNNSSQQLNSYLNKAMDSAATTKPSVAAPNIAKAAGALPKTKSGMKKFMDEYGKFIALGALAGTGGKGGAIAAPIMAALPGILKMLQNRGKKTTGAPAAASNFPALPTSGGDNPPAASSFPDLPTGGGDNPTVFDANDTASPNFAHGGLLGNKSAAHPKKKMAGGSIRKFSGGVMKKVTKKFAEGGEGKSDERESAFRRLDPVRGNRGERAKGLLAPLRKDSISEKLLKEDPKFKAGFLDEQMNDRDMKYSLASIVDEMYNSKNRMPTKGGAADDMSVKTMKEFYNDDSYESPMVDVRYDKKNRGTGGVPYDSPQFKVRQQRHINLGVGSPVDKTPKKMVGGTVRKFKGGSMNTMKDNLMPKYKKGGDMPKGMPKEMMAMMGKMQKGNTLRRGFGGQTAMPPPVGGMGMDQQMTPMGSNMRPPVGPMQPKMGVKGMPMGMGMKLPMKGMPQRGVVLTDPSATGRQPAVMNRRSGGTIRKFEGGTMNSMDDNLTPSYKKGGAMSKGMMAMMGKKGKATGDMPERKKMDMGMPIGEMPNPKKMGMAKPKPSSMDQKFAKGGTARYASGGMCKGYGMAKKIRPTGSMN